MAENRDHLPDKCPECGAPRESDPYYRFECGSTDCDNGVPREFRRGQECKHKLAILALTRISEARRMINGMVIDPCAQHMCYASQTADLAKLVLEKLKEK